MDFFLYFLNLMVAISMLADTSRSSVQVSAVFAMFLLITLNSTELRSSAFIPVDIPEQTKDDRGYLCLCGPHIGPQVHVSEACI